MIARLMFRLRGWWYRDVDHGNVALCVCCNRRPSQAELIAGGVRWSTIGTVHFVCSRHPTNPIWPYKGWERSGNCVLSSLPLSHWHPRERASWVSNNIQDALILGVPCTQEVITRGLELDRHNGRSIYVGKPTDYVRR